MSDELKRARAFEAGIIPKINACRRPAYHLTGTAGWINDPNGFSVYKDEIHLFFQANPQVMRPGQIGWGHVKTKDLVTWERLPAALVPDMPYDKDGCFSGGAVETEDGRHLLMYTGFVQRSGREGDVLQTQCMAVGDGVNYEKYEGNPVLAGGDLPEGSSEADFRDPKIWKDGDRYLAAVVNRDAEDRANVLIFESADGFSWNYKETAAESDVPGGRMWECPDLFRLDGKDAMLLSIQGRDGDVPEEEKAFAMVLRTGVFDREACRFRTDAEFIVDHGTDFYAPQTVLLPDGRRIMTAWMACWRTALDAPEDLDFRGQMILPRELSLKNGRLCQRPVRELEAYRGKYTVIRKHEGAGRFSHEDIFGRCCELDVCVRRKKGSFRDGQRKFRIHAAQDHSHRTVIEIDAGTGMITVDMTESGNPGSMSVCSGFPAEVINDTIKVKILLDRFSLELYANDGEEAAAFALYTPQEAGGISFEPGSGVTVDIEHYVLEF